MSGLGVLATLCAKEARVLLRDRQALLLLFAMPAVFVVVLSLAMEDIWRDKVVGKLAVAVAVEDGGEFARRFVETLERQTELELVPVDDAGAFDELFEAGTARAAVTVPAGFSDDAAAFLAAAGREPFGPNKLEWRASPLLDASYRSFLQSGLSLVMLETILDSLVEVGGEPAPPRDASLFLVEGESPRGELPTPLQQNVPGWSLFAMFFIVIPLAQGLFRERSEGTLRRILAYPVPSWAVLLGKLLPYLAVGALQFALMLAVGLFVVPLASDLSLELGADPLVLVPITLVCAFAATGYGLLVATLTRTPEQAAAVGATSVIVLAMLGGLMIPHFAMPASLQAVAVVSPLYWGHRAYLDAFLLDAGPVELALPLGVLLAFGAVAVAVAARRLRAT